MMAHHSRFQSILGCMCVLMILVGLLSGCGPKAVSQEDQRESTRGLLVFVTSGATIAREKAMTFGLKVKNIPDDSAMAQLVQALLNAPGKDYFVAINPAQRRVVEAGLVSDKINPVQLDEVFRNLKQISNVGKTQWGRLYPQTQGNAKLVVFSDFQCPYCKQMDAQLAEWSKQYNGKLEIEMIHFPLPSHNLAFAAAEAAECARAQGQFDIYQQELFKQQESLSEWTINHLAETLKLDQKAFMQCRAQHATRKKVRDDQFLGKYMGVNGTPSLYLNGEALMNISPMEINTQIQTALQNPVKAVALK